MKRGYTMVHMIDIHVTRNDDICVTIHRTYGTRMIIRTYDNVSRISFLRLWSVMVTTGGKTITTTSGYTWYRAQ